MNIASAGKFSSDRSIMNYAQDIWNAESLQVKYHHQMKKELISLMEKMKFASEEKAYLMKKSFHQNRLMRNFKLDFEKY